jgi:CRISPR/Cas system CSM-associated protein Csm2 small subunit
MKKILSVFVLSAIAATSFAAENLIQINYRALVSRGDLDYTNPTTRSEEGMPVGNGRMGSLVWTTPTALHFQINRVDVFGENSYTVSFPQADSDYAAGCGYLDINLVEDGNDVFTGKNFHQQLDIYDALMTANGNGVTARVIASPLRDVMAVEIDDERQKPEPISVDLQMLRYQIQRVTGRNYELATNHANLFRTVEQTALSKLDIRDGRILLTQQFRENDFYDSSAVAVSIVGRKSKAIYLDGSTVQLSAEAGKGKFTILISSAATFDSEKDVGGMAIDELKTAEAKSFSGLQMETADWWHDFWSKGFVYMHSAANTATFNPANPTVTLGQADFVEANYTYFLYLMGASSRGDFPPRFGGMLWRTTGDMSRWGSQYWWANQSAYVNNLMPCNRLELMDPTFKMYSGMYDACALAAKQQWGSQGIWIPEITFYNGPEKLPDNIAAELQDLMLCRKPYSERSTNFQFWIETKNRHNARYNFEADGHWDHGHWIVPTKGGSRSPDDSGEASDIFGHCTHILSDASKIANLYWQKYQFTMDTNWLRDRAYPMIRGAAEFYRNFPNFVKEADGKYHIHHVNNGESNWNSSDTPNEIDAMQMIFPLAIRASEILGVDADLRPKWQDIVDNLAPPAEMRGGKRNFVSTNSATNDTQMRFRGRDGAYGAFVYGGPGGIEPIGPQPELKSRFLGFDRTASFIDPEGGGGAQIFRNRLRLREGPGAIDAEHLGGLASGIHFTMLSSAPDSPAGDPVLSIFNQWPDDWDAAFQLLARGAFLVSSAHINGKIPLVEIQSQAGSDCVLKNPWPNETVTLYRNEKKAENVSGEILRFTTSKNEDIILVPSQGK